MRRDTLLISCSLALGIMVHRAWADETTQPTSIAEAAAPRAVMPGSGGVVVTATKAESAAAARIDQALDQPLREQWDFVDQPLNLMVQMISEEYEIPIHIDHRGLESAAIASDDGVTINVKNISLRSALDLMVHQIPVLAYKVDHEVLIITSEDVVEEEMEVRVYRIDDFWAREEGQVPDDGGGARAAYGVLPDVIAACVSPDSWQARGTGRGKIQQLPPGILIIYQTQHAHREIEQLLTTIRQCKSAIEGGDTEQAAENPFAVR